MIMEIIHYQKNNLVPQTRMLLSNYRIRIMNRPLVVNYIETKFCHTHRSPKTFFRSTVDRQPDVNELI